MSITGPREPISLPGGANICLSVTIAFEVFRYHSHYTHAPRGPKELDRFSLSYADYGAKAGAWRVFDVLERHGIKATFDIGGMAAEHCPEIIGEIHARGHEAAGHGYANDEYPSEADTERELEGMLAAIAAIEKGCGERPVGWVSPGSVGTTKTMEFMAREGFMWNGDGASDDMPFIQRVDGKPIVVLPRVNFPTNDLIVIVNPKNPPSAYLDGFKETFEFLYKEGRRGSPKWVDLLLHSDMSARPPIMAVFEKALLHAKTFGGVWMARRRHLASGCWRTRDDLHALKTGLSFR